MISSDFEDRHCTQSGKTLFLKFMFHTNYIFINNVKKYFFLLLCFNNSYFFFSFLISVDLSDRQDRFYKNCKQKKNNNINKKIN